VLADGLRCYLNPEASLYRFGKLACVVGSLLREFLLEEELNLLGGAWRVARGAAIIESLEAVLLPTVEVAPDARPTTAPGV
jgi:hypothetical protein